MSSAQLLDRGRLVLEGVVSNGCLPTHIPSYPPTPPNQNHQPNTSAKDEAKKMQWFSGFLHIMHQIVNIFMTIHLQVGIWGHLTSSQIEVIKVDNNGIRPSPKLDKGVACACRLSRCNRSCSLYDICKRRCLKTADRSGAGLPILCESDEERELEVVDRYVKRHLDAIRSKRMADTRQIDKEYRSLLRQITCHISQLVEEKKLPYNRLKGWVYMLRPRALLGVKIRGKDPPVDEMLNNFYEHWFATFYIRELIMKVEECVKEPLPVVKALEIFESKVDCYFSNRMSLYGIGSNGEPKALLCLDPEWSCYPARELYQLQKRACEALKRMRGDTFTVYFCTLLKEYMLLRHVEIFVHKMKEVIAEDTGGVSIVEDDHLVIPHSTNVVYIEGSSMLVLGINPRCGFGAVTQSVGCNCSQLDLAASGGHEYVMLESIKYFTSNYGP